MVKVMQIITVRQFDLQRVEIVVALPCCRAAFAAAPAASATLVVLDGASLRTTVFTCATRLVRCSWRTAAHVYAAVLLHAPQDIAAGCHIRAAKQLVASN